MHHQMTRSSLNDANMTGKVFIVLTVLVVDISICFGQYGGGEMGGAMGEMMNGVNGGLGAMMGGNGMSGFGGMLGGNGEMGGLGAMMGGGTGGGMGAGIGAMIRQSALANAMNTINEAVKFVVGPQAKPDEPLINYTMSQRNPPRNMMEMLPYLPHFQRIARETYASWLATQNTGAGGKSPAQLQADLDTLIMRKAIEYMNRPQTQRAAAGGANMAAIGAMIPRMIQGITAQFMQK